MAEVRLSDLALETGFVENLGSLTCSYNVDILTVISAEDFKLLSPSSAEKPICGPAAAAVIAASFLCFIG